MGVTDTYNCGTLWPSQVGEFAYVISSEDDNNYTIIYINLIPPMGQVESPERPFAHVTSSTGV